MRLITLFAFCAAFGAAATSAVAQPAVRGNAACRVDMATFCASIEAGRGRRMACLIANKDKLSAPCAAAVEQRAAQVPSATLPSSPSAGPGVPGVGAAPPAASSSEPQAAAPPAAAVPPPQTKDEGRTGRGRLAACRAELQTVCASVPAGGGGRIRCLQENQAKLSPTCVDAMSAISAARQATRGACADDAKSLCPGRKGPERRACFTANVAKLSPACAAVQANTAKR